MSGSFAMDLRPDGTAVVRAEGELDVLTAPSFSAVLNRAVDSARSTVVIDLTEVSFADVTGLRPMFTAEAQLQLAGRDLVTHGVQPAVARVINLCVELA